MISINLHGRSVGEGTFSSLGLFILVNDLAIFNGSIIFGVVTLRSRNANYFFYNKKTSGCPIIKSPNPIIGGKPNVH